MTDRRTGAVGVNVDLQRTGITLNRQTGSVGVTVDLKVLLPPISLSGSVVQATSVSVQLVFISGGTTYPRAVSFSQGTAVLLRLDPYRLRLTTSQSTLATITALRLPSSIPLTVTAAQATQVAISWRQTLRRTLTTLTQAQTATSVIGRGYRRTLTATQTQAVRLVKQVRILIRTTGTHRVQTAVQLGRVVGRVIRASQPTSPRLPKQVRITRTLTQAQSASLSGLPVKLQAVATVQTRSLAIGRVVTLMRAIGQSTLAYLGGQSSLTPTLQQTTTLSRQQAVQLTRSIVQPAVATLVVQDVTPRLFLTLVASVGQSVSLSQSSTGAPAKHFVISGREASFVVAGRSSQFVTNGRRVRFTVEDR